MQAIRAVLDDIDSSLSLAADATTTAFLAILQNWPTSEVSAIWIRDQNEPVSRVRGDDCYLELDQLAHGESSVSVDLSDLWNDEIRFGSGQIEGSIANTIIDSISAIVSTDPTLSQFSSDFDKQFIGTGVFDFEAVVEWFIGVADTGNLEKQIRQIVFGNEDWWRYVDWRHELPTELLVSYFLDESPSNWLIDDGFVLCVGQGFVRDSVPSLRQFMDIVQRRMDEAEVAEILHIDYFYDSSYSYLDPAVEEAAGQIPDRELSRAEVEEVLSNLPQSVRKPILREVGKGSIAGDKLRHLLLDRSLELDVTRGDEKYRGETISGKPYTFTFHSTPQIQRQVDEIGAVASRVWRDLLSGGGHYGDALAYVRIDAESVELSDLFDVDSAYGNLSGKTWIVENIQSDPLSRINRYLGAGGKQAREFLVDKFGVSKSEVERQINRLNNLFSEWPFMIGRFLEESAALNGIQWLLWTSSEFQAERWGRDSWGEYYYDQVPKRLGYRPVSAAIEIYGEEFSPGSFLLKKIKREEKTAYSFPFLVRAIHDIRYLQNGDFRIEFESGNPAQPNPRGPIVKIYEFGTNSLVASYYASTILEHDDVTGITMRYGSSTVDPKILTSDSVVEIKKWIRQIWPQDLPPGSLFGDL